MRENVSLELQRQRAGEVLLMIGTCRNKERKKQGRNREEEGKGRGQREGRERGKERRWRGIEKEERREGRNTLAKSPNLEKRSNKSL